MSRELKFRAWDDDAEYMFYSDKVEDDYFFEFKDGKLRGFALREPRGGDDPHEPPEPYCDEFDVEQYTGLKDKNGVKIFEGDIINYNLTLYLIEYREASFVTVNVLGEWEGYLMLAGTDRMEVIGSIHTTPKLLEKE